MIAAKQKSVHMEKFTLWKSSKETTKRLYWMMFVRTVLIDLNVLLIMLKDGEKISLYKEVGE